MGSTSGGQQGPSADDSSLGKGTMSRGYQTGNVAVDSKGDPVKGAGGYVGFGQPPDTGPSVMDAVAAIQAEEAKEVSPTAASVSAMQAQMAADAAAAENQPAGFNFGDTISALTDTFKTKFSPEGIVGTVIGTALFGPIGGFVLGNIAGSYGDDDDSNNAFGNIGQAIRTDFSNLGDMFSGLNIGSAPSMEPDRGGNKPILPIETPPTSEELITQNPLMPMMTDQQRLAMLYRLPTGGITNFLT